MENKEQTPCDSPFEENGQIIYRCPFEGQTSESELCRVCCGLGVDE